MADLLPLGTFDTQRAGSEAAQQWSNFNLQQAQQQHLNSITQGQDLQNKSVAQKQAEEQAATNAFNAAWTPAVAPGQQAPGQRMNGPWNNNGLPQPLPATPQQNAALASGQGPLNPQAAAQQQSTPAPSLGSLGQMALGGSTQASTPSTLGSLGQMALGSNQAPSPTLNPVANILKNNENPYPNVADHPAAQALYALGNQSDTSSSVADDPTHAPVQVTPKGSLDRNAFYQSLADQGHANLIPDFQDRFTKSDQQAQVFKEQQAIQAHAVAVAGFAAFQSLPDDMKPAYYQQELAGLKAQGVDISSFPAQYDPSNKQNVAFVDGLASQATSALDKLKDQHETTNANIAAYNSETARMKNQDQSMSDYEKAQIGLGYAKLRADQADNTNSGGADPATIHGIVMGQLPAPTGRALVTPQGQALMSAVFKEDPNFSTQRSQIRHSFTTGPDATNIGNLNTATLHLDDYISAAQAMKNGSFQPGNALYNKLSTVFGQGNPITLETIKNAVVGEQASALKGNATDAEIAHVSETYNKANSPQQFMDAGKAALKVMSQKLGTYQERYNQQIPGDTTYSPILPNANQIFQKYGIRTAAPQSKVAAPSNVAPTSAPQTNYEGQVSPSGKYVFTNGNWKAK